MKKYLLVMVFLISSIISLGEDSNIENIFMEEVRNENEVKKELNIIQSIKIQTLDPIKMRDQYSERAVKLIYDTLFNIEDGKVIPYLVKDYKWQDERTLFIELKDGVVFHNGEELSSNDVKFTFERFSEEGALKDTFEEIRNIKIINNKKLIMKLEEEDTMFLKKLTYVSGSIVKKTKNGITGSGRFYPSVFNNGQVLLKRYLNYFRGKSIVNKIRFTHEINDKKKMTSLFDEGSDVAFDVSENTFNEAKKEGIIPDDVLVRKNNLMESSVLRFGNKNKEIYTRKNRKLIEKMIDREDISRKITGTKDNMATTYFPTSLFDVSFSRTENNFDEKVIKSELKKGTLNKEINLMILNNMLDMANIIKRQFAEYGIKVNILPHNLDSYAMKIQTGDYDVALYNMVYKDDYILLNIRSILLNDIKDVDLYNAIDPFLKIAMEEKDKIKRDKIFDKIVQLIYKELPYIPIVHEKLLVVGYNKLDKIYNVDKKVD
ncbi:ABC transporter substrate-binding protein [Fusobacterium sp. MFO224]|uniref:ABC transporter substrate-binding protein n=1 Tax=Fusobacterium sp. MFO224 TaxID=3378070 RepID=UPI003854DB54